MRSRRSWQLLPVAATIALATGLAGAALVFVDTGVATQRAALDRQWAPVDFLLRADPDGAGFDPATVERVRRIPGVRAADGIEATGGTIAGQHVGVNTLPTSPELRGLEPVSGRQPERTGEAVVDAESAREHGWTLGSTLRIDGTSGGEQRVTVVGTVDSTGLRQPDVGYVAALAVPASATEMVVALDPNVDSAGVLRDVREATGLGVTAQTRGQVVRAGVVAQDWHELTPGVLLVLCLTLGLGGALAMGLAGQISGSSRWGLIGLAAAGPVGLAAAVAAVALANPALNAVGADLDGVAVTPRTAGIVLASGLVLALLSGIPVLRRQRRVGDA